jgi:hypothetical protein
MFGTYKRLMHLIALLMHAMRAIALLSPKEGKKQQVETLAPT